MEAPEDTAAPTSETSPVPAVASDNTPPPPPPPTATDEPTTSTNLSPAEQARIRRERRKAKVVQGADRLKKLSSTQKSGEYVDRSEEIFNASQPQAQAQQQQQQQTWDNVVDDPPIAEIAEHMYQPKRTPRPDPDMMMGSLDTPPAIDDMQFQQMLASSPFFQQQQQRQGQGQQQGGASGGMPQDPMMDLMQQLLGMPPPDGFGGQGGGGPPGTATGMQQQQQQPAPGFDFRSSEDPYAKWWTLLHSVCAILLGLYAAWTTDWSYRGTKQERIGETYSTLPIFWYFATMELLLQSTRYILEKGRPPPGSILSNIGALLPRPFGTFLTTLARYSVIWSTVVNDGFLLLFVMGALSWWNS